MMSCKAKAVVKTPKETPSVCNVTVQNCTYFYIGFYERCALFIIIFSLFIDLFVFHGMSVK